MSSASYGSYPGESLDPMPFEGVLFVITFLGFICACLCMSVCVDIPFGILLFIMIVGGFICASFCVCTYTRINNTTVSEEYETGYNDALSSKTDLYEQFKDVTSSKRIEDYTCGYKDGLKEKQRNKEEANENEKRVHAETVLNEQMKVY